MSGTATARASYEAYRAKRQEDAGTGYMPEGFDRLPAEWREAWEAAAQAVIASAELTHDADLRRERDEARAENERLRNAIARSDVIAEYQRLGGVKAELDRLREQLDAADAGAIDTLRAFAQDEILANAGDEWDRPLGPEQNAVEYVRHLEQAFAEARAVVAEMAAHWERVGTTREEDELMPGWMQRAGIGEG